VRRVRARTCTRSRDERRIDLGQILDGRSRDASINGSERTANVDRMNRANHGAINLHSRLFGPSGQSALCRLPLSLSRSLFSRARRRLRFRGGEIDDVDSSQIDSIAEAPPRSRSSSRELSSKLAGREGSFSYFPRHSRAIESCREILAHPRRGLADDNGDNLRAHRGAGATRVPASTEWEHGEAERRRKEKGRGEGMLNAIKI